MTGPVAQMLPGGRLHLQHGPIDLVLGADGATDHAFECATTRFETVLTELMEEYAALRQPGGTGHGETAARMSAATGAHRDVFVTPMAAVAGAVADTVLAAMRAARITRAYVNNGGDIALHLEPGQRFDLAMADPEGRDLGRIHITAEDAARGIATSGWRGRSLSLGIADSVTVLARSAASADVAATLIANAVDLPDHPGIQRSPAVSINPDSDLGEHLVTTAVPQLQSQAVAAALEAGAHCAARMMQSGEILGAALFLCGDMRTIGHTGHIQPLNRSRAIA